MSLKFYDSPFHVTHADEVASKMAMKVDLSIMIGRLIAEQGWTQKEAAQKLGLYQSRISDLINSKVDQFTIDAMFDILDKLGYHARMSMSSSHEAAIVISRAAA